MFRSVTSRITFTCIFLFGTLFFCQLVLLYGFMQVDMKKHEERMLFGMFYRIQDQLKENGLQAVHDRFNQPNERNRKHGPNHGPGPMMFIRIFNSNGQTVLQNQYSKNWPQIAAPKDFTQYMLGQSPVIHTVVNDGNSGSIRYCIGKVTPQYILQVGQGQNNFDPFFEHLIKIALILLPVTMILVGLAGWFVSRQAMNGVKQVTRAASSINKGNLDLRVEVGNSGQEIQDLASNFNTMLAKIQALIQELEDVTNNIAHDLRSPLTRMRGIIETTLRAKPDTNAYHNMSAQLIEEIERLHEMINTMLQIASAEAGIDKTEMQTVDMNAILHDAVDLFTPLAEEKQQTLQLQLPDKPVMVLGSRPRLQRVIANLLDNANKFTSNAGTIKVNAKELDAQTVQLQIQDTGPGIDPQILPQIFDRFYSGDQSRTNKGNGLGLSYVRAIVQAHHGQIHVSSSQAPSKDNISPTGAIFTITLPSANSL